MVKPEAASPPILDAHGRPARAGVSRACPRCQGNKRVASAGFGAAHPVCPRCGYEWLGETFEPEEEAR